MTEPRRARHAETDQKSCSSTGTETCHTCKPTGAEGDSQTLEREGEDSCGRAGSEAARGRAQRPDRHDQGRDPGAGLTDMEVETVALRGGPRTAAQKDRLREDDRGDHIMSAVSHVEGDWGPRGRWQRQRRQ